MSDNISRRIEQMVEKFCDDYCGSVDCANCGVSAETVTEFLKAERSGHWEIYVISPFDGEGCRCSECGTEGAPYWGYCPNCGADMRGVDDESTL